MNNKERRISVTNNIISGINTMVNSGCMHDNDKEFILSWLVNITRFQNIKYSIPSKSVLERLQLLKNQYVEHRFERDGLIYHKSILDAINYIDKINDRYIDQAKYDEIDAKVLEQQ